MFLEKIPHATLLRPHIFVKKGFGRSIGVRRGILLKREPKKDDTNTGEVYE